MKKLILIIAIVLLSCGGLAQATNNITFTSSGTISDPCVYGNVEVRNDGTVLKILGGTINALYTSDNSSIEMHGGIINVAATLSNESGFLMDGGTIGSILGGSAIDINGGVFSSPSGYIKSFGAIVNIRGGITPLGGNFGIYIYRDDGAVNIYGDNFISDPSLYKISGNLADGNPFVFSMDNHTYEKTTLHIVPEPAALCFLVIGSLLLRRKF